VLQPVQASLPERRTAEVLAEPLEPRAIARGDVHRGVEVEPAVVGMERDVTLDPRRVWIGAEPHGTSSRAPAEGDATEDCRPGEARQRRRLVRERIDETAAPASAS
jgi:hypothetical protein